MTCGIGPQVGIEPVLATERIVVAYMVSTRAG